MKDERFSSLQHHVQANIIPFYEAFDNVHSVDHVQAAHPELVGLFMK